ncbi:hypothetical protein [Microcoleus sp. bin38.metabat.b11b12b14.051]|uniref:hypothetical protein n=1 Tax=Microcoleus sp. bin38.metabat.b11b12b14.051 TaxID=2742709 RepID=UPI0025CBBC33|nr:hypothetical protein [Microcoleus sp. bin38.metabat.b11b12b14.051]
MKKIAKQIPNLEAFRDYCRSLIPLMNPSFSRYTDRRLQLWIFNEVNLGNGKVSPGYFDGRLYEFCQRIYPGCDIGLLTYHGKASGGSSGVIRPHGDHAYAKPRAININLGVAEFSIDGKLYKLNDGDIVEFNCKKVHAVPRVLSEERFSLVLWQLNEARGYRSSIDFPIAW